MTVINLRHIEILSVIIQTDNQMIMYHEPLAHFPGSKMTLLPGIDKLARGFLTHLQKKNKKKHGQKGYISHDFLSYRKSA